MIPAPYQAKQTVIGLQVFYTQKIADCVEIHILDDTQLQPAFCGAVNARRRCADALNVEMGCHHDADAAQICGGAH